MSDYDWITDEMFDDALMEIIDKVRINTLVREVEGVYELVKEYYNNDVLTKLEKERGEEA